MKFSKSSVLLIVGALLILPIGAIGYVMFFLVENDGKYEISLSTNDNGPQSGDRIAGSLIIGQPNSLTVEAVEKIYSPFEGSVVADGGNKECSFIVASGLEQVFKGLVPSPVYRICGSFSPFYGETGTGQAVGKAGTIGVSVLTPASSGSNYGWVSREPSWEELQSLLTPPEGIISSSGVAELTTQATEERPPLLRSVLVNEPVSQAMVNTPLVSGSDRIYSTTLPKEFGSELQSMSLKNPQHLCTPDSLVQQGSPAQSTIPASLTTRGLKFAVNLTATCPRIGEDAGFNVLPLAANIVFDDGCKTPAAIEMEGGSGQISSLSLSFGDSDCAWGENLSSEFTSPGSGER